MYFISDLLVLMAEHHAGLPRCRSRRPKFDRVAKNFGEPQVRGIDQSAGDLSAL